MPAEGPTLVRGIKRKIAIAMATAIAVIPSIRYLWDLRYRLDPALGESVCQSLACSDELVLDTAKRASLSGAPNTPVVLANLREALRRNIASPNRWCDLGQALRQAGRVDEARYCYSQALDLGPSNPPVLWRTALFYLRIKDRRSALKYMAELLEVAPHYRDLIFSIYLVNIRDVVETLEFGIPKQGPIAKEYFGYILQNARAEDVKKAWDWMKTSGGMDVELAGKYVEYLIARGESWSAVEVWKSATGNDNAYLHPNLIYNGDFEAEPLKLGLDWTFHPNRSVHIQRVSAPAFSGSSSMEIDFDGSENVEFNDLTENVIIGPGRYHFKAWIRTSELTTDQGISFRLVDPSNRQAPVTTSMLTQTHGWTPIEMDFIWSGSMQQLRIEVVRHASWKFDNKIKGSVWIDGVSLTKIGSPQLSSKLPQQLSAK
jgi:hypothetical protein